MARLNELLLEPLRMAFCASTLVTSVHGAEIVTSTLGTHDVAVGAATCAAGNAPDPRYFGPAVASS